MLWSLEAASSDTLTQLWRSRPGYQQYPDRSEWYASATDLSNTDAGTSKTFTLGESGSIYGTIQWAVGSPSSMNISTVSNGYDLTLGLSNLTITVGDAAGAKVVEIKDSGGSQVWRVDSDGNQQQDGSLTFGDTDPAVLSRPAANILGLAAGDKFLLNGDAALADSAGRFGMDNVTADAKWILGQGDTAATTGYVFWDYHVSDPRFLIGAGTAGSSYVSFDPDGNTDILPPNMKDVVVGLGWSPGVGTGKFRVYGTNAAADRAYIDANGYGWLYGDLLVDGANIGVTAAPELLTMASGLLTVAGSVKLADSGQIGTASEANTIVFDNGTSVTVNAGLEVDGLATFTGNVRSLGQLRGVSLKIDSGPIYLPTGSVPDSSLSANVMLLDNEQTVTGHKIFSTNPTVGGTRAASFGLKTHGPSDGDQYLNFYEDGASGGEYLRWSDAADEFQLTDDFDLSDSLEVHGTTQLDGVTTLLDDLNFGASDAPVLDQGGAHVLRLDAASVFALNADTALGTGVIGADNLSATPSRFTVWGPSASVYAYTEWDKEVGQAITDGFFGIGTNARTNDVRIGGADIWLVTGPSISAEVSFRDDSLVRTSGVDALGFADFVGLQVTGNTGGEVALAPDSLVLNSDASVQTSTFVEFTGDAGGSTGWLSWYDADYAFYFSGLYVDPLVKAGQFQSTSVGVPAIVPADTTLNTNLNADLFDGLDSTAFAGGAHTHPASDVVSGTLSTDRYSAYSDLTAEGYAANIAMLNEAETVSKAWTFSLDPYLEGTTSPFRVDSDNLYGGILYFGTSGAANGSFVYDTFAANAFYGITSASTLADFYMQNLFLGADPGLYGYTTADGSITLHEEQGASDKTLTIQTSDSQSETWTLTFPVSNGDPTQYFKTDGSGVASWDTIDLGTDTSGNYMAAVTAGTGVTVSHTPGEGSSAEVAIGQAVGTSATPTFAGLTVNGTVYLGPATESDKAIYAYEDSSATGEYILWNDANDQWYLSDQLTTQDAIISLAGLYYGQSGTGGYTALLANGNMYLDIDDDGGSTAYFYIRSGDTVKVTIDESGNVTFVGGIKATLKSGANQAAAGAAAGELWVDTSASNVVKMGV